MARRAPRFDLMELRAAAQEIMRWIDVADCYEIIMT